MRHVGTVLLVACVGCGGATTPPKPSDAPPPAASDTPTAVASNAVAETSPQKADQEQGIPTRCARETPSPCVMPLAYVKRLCAGAHPDLALAFFAKGTPWTRGWVSIRQADPFNGFGGPTAEEKLVFEEEVLILAERKPNLGGMSVSGVGASYDLLRWDGTCATLSAQEVTLSRPPKPRHATIPWRQLDEATRNALMKDDRVAKLAADRRKECKGATMGQVSAKCEKADKGLNEAVAEVVRAGLELPIPK